MIGGAPKAGDATAAERTMDILPSQDTRTMIAAVALRSRCRFRGSPASVKTPRSRSDRPATVAMVERRPRDDLALGAADA